MAFANLLLEEFAIEDQFDGVRILVPPSAVLGTNVFDEFLDTNDLRELAMSSDNDAEIAERFQAARFGDEIRTSLRAFLELCTYPLAVRSSSLLEDAKYQPFAGIYETLMIPNNDADIEVRLEHLVSATKQIYASTFSQNAKHYLVSTSYRLEEEKMAVIIQRLVGGEHGDRFYPELAGVALSHNYYPVGPINAEDGIVAVALGLGPTVVEGGECLRFVPKHPNVSCSSSSVKDT